MPGGDHTGPPLWGFALDGYPLSGERLKEVEKETGLPSRIVVFFLQWPSLSGGASSDFPEGTLNAVRDSGAVPCLTWEPMYYENGHERMVPYKNIIEGRYDSYILEFARRARLWEKPFMVRFAHEMNLDRYHWGTDKPSYGPGGPDIYKRMFRHVVGLFRKAGAKNVLWVFCPNAESVPNVSHDATATWNRVANYYPGDEYVDILGMDGYNWGTSRTEEKHGWKSRWQSFEEIFRSIYRELQTLAPHKPVIVFETASVSQGGDRLKWIRDALTTAEKWKLMGVVWFQVNKDDDWRINSDDHRLYIDMIREKVSFRLDWIKDLRK
jgi:hypothetical protein